MSVRCYTRCYIEDRESPSRNPEGAFYLRADEGNRTPDLLFTSSGREVHQGPQRLAPPGIAPQKTALYLSEPARVATRVATSGRATTPPSLLSDAARPLRPGQDLLGPPVVGAGHFAHGAREGLDLFRGRGPLSPLVHGVDAHAEQHGDVTHGDRAGLGGLTHESSVRRSWVYRKYWYPESMDTCTRCLYGFLISTKSKSGPAQVIPATRTSP